MVLLKYITKRCSALHSWTAAWPTVRKLSGLWGINFSSVGAGAPSHYPSAGTGRKSMRPVERSDALIHRTRSAGALRTTGFTRIDVTALPSALRPSHIRERLLERDVVGVHAIAQPKIEGRACKDPIQRSHHNVGHIVGNAPAIRESG